MARLMDEVVGHERVKLTLRETLQKQSIPPAFIFSGPSGVGKFKLALGWAQSLLCENTESSPCGFCNSCLSIENEQHSNLIVVKPEKSTTKIEQTKEVIRKLSLRQIDAKRRVVIFDQAETLNAQAANSILKIVEEPPPGTHFVFVTSAFHSLLPTLRSRSQRISFQPLSREELEKISGHSGWMIGSAQGRLDQLEKLVDEEHASLRALSLSTVTRFFDETSWVQACEELKEIMKDREGLGFVALVWKQLIRDSFIQDPSQRIHMDCDLSPLSRAGEGSRLEAYDEIVGFERALLGNADPSLSVESLFIRVKSETYGQQGLES